MAKIKNDRKLTLQRLKEVLRYEPDTGMFFWLVTLSPKAVAGSQAGAIRKRGYRIIIIDGEQHKASRLAWLYAYGEFPDKLVDHENRIKSDDRLENLRLANFAENIWNTGQIKTNTSGLKGAFQTKWGWQSSISCYGKRIYLGSFGSATEAAAAYEQAARNMRGEFASAG